jgi:hypothetical protein
VPKRIVAPLRTPVARSDRRDQLDRVERNAKPGSPAELRAEKLARYEEALQRLSQGALGPTTHPHPLIAIGRIATRLLEGASIEGILRELRNRER